MQEKIQKFSPIKQRILQFVDTLGISKREFYAKIGVSRGTLESATGITEETLAKFIVIFPEISADWLLTGRGEMLRDGVASGHNESGTQQIIQGNNNSHNSVTVGQAVAELQKAIEEKDNTIRLQAETIARLSQMIRK